MAASKRCEQRRWTGLDWWWLNEARSASTTCRAATDKPFGVNLPILHYDIKNLATVVAEEGVSIVFTSAGNPKTLTPVFKQAGMKVVQQYFCEEGTGCRL